MGIKIHANKLTNRAKKALYKEISNTQQWGFTTYALDKIQKREIPVEILSKTIAKGKLVEFHTNKESRRVLLRDDGGTCAVVDLDKQSIITAYKNHINYNHPRLDTTKYLFGA